MKDLLLSPPFCECLLLWAHLRAMQQAKVMQSDSLPRRARPSYDRAWLVKKQAPQQGKTMQRFRLVPPSFEPSCARV